MTHESCAMLRLKRLFLLTLIFGATFLPCQCFSGSPTLRIQAPPTKTVSTQRDNEQHFRRFFRIVLPRCWMSDPDKGNDELEDEFLRRFTNPKIDDPGLPLSDTALAQVVAPSLQVFWLSLVHAPSPTWLRPIFDNTLFQYRGSLVAPTLIHGAALASCWVAGALAAEAFERKSYDLSQGGYATVMWRIFRAGAFATGLLILGTQVDLLLEFGRYVQPGESDETDLRLLSAFVEVLNDVIFEALTLVPWRLYRASLTSR